MSPLPSESGTPQAIVRLGEQLTSVSTRLEALHARFETLVDENARLRERLEHSETARADLVAQSEQILHLLAESRREVQELRARQQAPQQA